MDSIYYVYVYKHPITQVPRYVGKGKKNRAYAHLKGSSNKNLAGWINNLKEQDLTPLIDFVATDLEEELALLVEVEAISKYGRQDKQKGPLFNHTDGGDGGAMPWTQYSRDKLSKTTKGRPGKKKSPEQLQKMSETAKRLGIKPPSRKGAKHPCTPEQKLKIGLANGTIMAIKAGRASPWPRQ